MNNQNIFTGTDRPLGRGLLDALEGATEVRFIVSFLRESGVRMILPSLETLADRQVPIRILTGTYMNITEPGALYLLKERLGDRVDLRLFDEPDRSFHPKTYLVFREDGNQLFIGSSNLSRSALEQGVEWNYRLREETAPEDFLAFAGAFDTLFAGSQPATAELLRAYARQWRKPVVTPAEPLRDRKKAEVLSGDDCKTEEPFPRGAQLEALYELKLAREEGITRGMVVAATGTGKTYLAAFDSREFPRVLFLAHRQEILAQAMETFLSVRPGDRASFFGGGTLETEGNLVFAGVQTLGKPEYLNPRWFAPDHFDYIVIDEFHHVAAESYRNVFGYFQPKFMLGLTATPFRMDQKDIFSFCDDNVIYEVGLREAIGRDLLVPFRYYGIYDDTDYSVIGYSGGRYNASQLERALMTGNRASLVLDKYLQFRGSRAMGFCSTIRQARYMAEHFRKNGIRAEAVYSQPDEGDMDRGQALRELAEGRLEIIFTVDLFNEGVDVPSLDTVLFLRPTESHTVFLQQLGRGLRKYPGKRYLQVLDFIGNFRRAHHIPLLLSGANPMEVAEAREAYGRITDLEPLPGCTVQFDFRLIDLFDEMRRNDPLSRRMKEEYFRLKGELGRRPLRFDLLEGSDIAVRHFLKEGYLTFLREAGELTGEEGALLETESGEFLKKLEKTSMTRSYKIPVLMALVDISGPFPDLKTRVTAEEIGRSFQEFYTGSRLHQKDLSDKSNRNWEKWGLEEFKRLALKNPVHFLSSGAMARYFSYDPGREEFSLNLDLSGRERQQVAAHLEDIIRYRNRDYFRRKYYESPQ